MSLTVWALRWQVVLEVIGYTSKEQSELEPNGNTMFASLEKPMANVVFACSVFALLWKSPLGIAWIPGVGAGWLGMFAPGGEDGAKLAQLPRRSEDETFWGIVYFLMYGVLATAAQYGGLQLSKRSVARSRLELYAKLYGIFHVVIGVHHLLWSLATPAGSYGKFELWRYNLPGSYEGTALAALLMIYNAVMILTVRGSIREICLRKAVLDTASLCTFIAAAFFCVCNLAGIETTFETERIVWAITMYSLPVVMILGHLHQADSACC